MREYIATPGRGPRLHRHPYAETFVIHHGRALFTVGEEQVVGVGGQILVVPSLVDHRFEVLSTAAPTRRPTCMRATASSRSGSSSSARTRRRRLRVASTSWLSDSRTSASRCATWRRRSPSSPTSGSPCSDAMR
ncbi:cupin domain-containing protein [Microbacterium luteolum]|uniref:cupin domain-containing protein n=1 Tax=Microbacterium luteolum TaxID=69367 RepID=UPI00249C3B74|nr:cupin domain-containing protein [Microbacterium luteolum]